MEKKEALAIVTQVADQFIGKWSDQLVLREALRVLAEAIEPAFDLVNEEDEK